MKTNGKELKRKLKVLRAINDLTQTDIAKAAGVSIATVSYYEAGKSQNEKLAKYVDQLEKETYEVE